MKQTPVRLNDLTGKEWVRLTRSVWCDGPTTFVPNVSNQFVLIARKLSGDPLGKKRCYT